jgi:hypothetical protein
MLKTLIAAILGFVFGVAITKHFDDKKIIQLHRDYDRTMDKKRSDTFSTAWEYGYKYALDRYGIEDTRSTD